MAGTPSAVGADVGRTMTRVTNTLRTATKAAMADAGKVAKVELTATSRIVPGADARFRNMRRYNHGGKLAVKAKAFPGGVTIIPRGPWMLAEVGARPHGGHPGTRSTQGRKAWTQGREATYRRLELDVPEQIADAVEGAFHA